jgi:hypothetical protein
MKWSDEQFVREMVRQKEHEAREAKLAKRLQKDYSVFISYSHADVRLRKQLTSLFDNKRIYYEVDEKAFELGDSINDVVVEAISRCTHYLLILSEHSENSGWCKYEFGVAVGKGKEVLIFLASNNVMVPAFASNILATADINDFVEHFTKKLIDPIAVEQFILEIFSEIDINRFAGFQYKRKEDSGLLVWQYEQLSRYNKLHVGLLELIGIGEGNDLRMVLIDNSDGRYEFSYSDVLRSVVVYPRYRSAGALGVRETRKEGGEKIVLKRASFMDRIFRRIIYGWPASESFWEETLRTVSRKLPQPTFAHDENAA